MKEQNFSNHTRLVPAFHYVLFSAIIVLIVCSSISLFRHWNAGLGLMLPAIALLGSVCMVVLGFLARSFSLKAQDRAIRAEENLRYFAITGNLLDKKINMRQVVALRFSPDNEIVDLAHKAAQENLSSKEIKSSIKNWRGDYNRV
jgi:uncharacterized integral membrane protein